MRNLGGAELEDLVAAGSWVPVVIIPALQDRTLSIRVSSDTGEHRFCFLSHCNSNASMRSPEADFNFTHIQPSRKPTDAINSLRSPRAQSSSHGLLESTVFGGSW